MSGAIVIAAAPVAVDRSKQRMSYVLILASVFLSAFSQVILRYGMTRDNIAAVLSGSSSFLTVFSTIIRSPFVIAGLSCYSLGAVLWLLVLSKIPVSLAYPFVSLSIVLTMIAAHAFLEETLSFTTLLGGCLIVGGILCLALGR